MIDLIKYSRIALRKASYPIDPHCPLSSIKTKTEILAAGSKIQFVSPINFQVPGVSEERTPKLDCLINRFPDVLPSVDGLEPIIEDWDTFFRSWAFCGPWFSGVSAYLCLRVSIVKPLRLSKTANLLHPAGFKFSIGELLEAQYGSDIFDGKKVSDFTGPFQWQCHSQDNVLSASLEMEHKSGRQVRIHYFQGFGKDKFINFEFNLRRYSNGKNKVELDQQIKFDNLIALSEKIMKTVKVEYSNQIMQEIRIFKSEGETPPLDLDFPPIDWTGLCNKDENLSLN